MSKHTTTHLFFHLNDNTASGSKINTFSGARKPKRATTTTNHELNSSNSFDYYEYFSNYGRLATPPHSPSHMMPRESIRDRDYRYEETRRAYSGDRDRDRRFWRRSGPPKYEIVKSSDSPEKLYQRPHSGHREMTIMSPATESPQSPSQNLPPLTSPPSDIMMTPDSALHRITFIETHIYQPQDLPSPLHYPRHRIPPQPPSQHHEWMVANVKQLRSHFAHPFHQILMNVETQSKFPFIIYSSANANLSSCALSPELRYTDGLYAINSSISRPGSGFQDDESTRPAGFIISAFATFPGEDSDKLERNWISWTGARVLYKYLPMCVGLRRLIFLKRTKDYKEEYLGNYGFTYVLLCECFNLRESYIASACTTIDQLRARCCGYTALYINQRQC